MYRLAASLLGLALLAGLFDALNSTFTHETLQLVVFALISLGIASLGIALLGERAGETYN